MTSRNQRNYALLFVLVSVTVAAVSVVSFSIESTGADTSILSPKLSEAQQEENDVQALEAKYLAKERASDKVERGAFRTVQKLSKIFRHKRPLWGKRKWPSYYANVFTSKDAFSADEPKHPIHNFDQGDDDGSIDSVRSLAQKRSFHQKRSLSKKAVFRKEPARAHFVTDSAKMQDLYELDQVQARRLISSFPQSSPLFESALIWFFVASFLFPYSPKPIDSDGRRPSRHGGWCYS